MTFFACFHSMAPFSAFHHNHENTDAVNDQDGGPYGVHPTWSRVSIAQVFGFCKVLTITETILFGFISIRLDYLGYTTESLPAEELQFRWLQRRRLLGTHCLKPLLLKICRCWRQQYTQEYLNISNYTTTDISMINHSEHRWSWNLHVKKTSSKQEDANDCDIVHFLH